MSIAQTLERRGEGDAQGVLGVVFEELREALIWYDALDPTLKFLFGLPFIVAAAGLAGDWLRRRRGNRQQGV